MNIDETMKAKWKHKVQQMEDNFLLRQMRVSGVGPLVHTQFGDKLIFCSNDYLGLASSKKIAQAAMGELSNGLGAAASRLVSGNFEAHEHLERCFASFAGKSSSVLFPSGYQANVGAISALTGEDDVIFSDELSHASIVDGCRLSKARVEIYRHNDVDHLVQLLGKHTSANVGKLVITEGIFSMDGDFSPLDQICQSAQNAGAALYVDEAHSLGIVGPLGKGWCAQYGLTNQIDVLIGTFGKALGASGAAVACDEVTAKLLKSSARSLLYTTAPPACIASAVSTSLHEVQCADALRQRLNANITHFKSVAASKKIPLRPSDTPIQPVMIGSAQKTMEVSQYLWEEGFFVQGIRPPTVPVGTERLRVTLSVSHTFDQIEQLIEKLAECLVMP